MDMNLSNEEKIVSLLDGELPQEEIGDLFLELHHNDALQEEFLSDIKFRQLTPATMISPPEVVKEDILSAVAVNAAASTPVLFEPGFLFGLLAACITAFGVYNFDKGFESSAFAQIPFIPIQQEQPVVPLAEYGDIELAMILAPEPENEVIAYSSVRSIQDMPVQDVAQQNIKSLHADNNTISDEAVRTAMDLVDEYTDQGNQNRQVPLTNSLIEKSYTSSNWNNSWDQSISERTNRLIPTGIGFGLENNSKQLFANTTNSQLDLPIEFTLRGISAASTINVDVQRGSMPTFNNFAIAAHYIMDDNWLLGFEIGQEDYDQVFEGIDKNDRVFYEQVITAFWGGLSLKFQTDPVAGENMSIYSTALLGGTRVGAIGRLGTGLNFRLSDKLSINTGLELNSLVYRHQGNIFDTFKYGATYGLVFRP